MLLMVISEAEIAGVKEQPEVAPKKRQLLDSDEEQEEDEGGSKGRETGACSFPDVGTLQS